MRSVFEISTWRKGPRGPRPWSFELRKATLRLRRARIPGVDFWRAIFCPYLRSRPSVRPAASAQHFPGAHSAAPAQGGSPPPRPLFLPRPPSPLRLPACHVEDSDVELGRWEKGPEWRNDSSDMESKTRSLGQKARDGFRMRRPLMTREEGKKFQDLVRCVSILQTQASRECRNGGWQKSGRVLCRFVFLRMCISRSP